MASETSEPNNVNILKIGVLGIVTLVAVRFALVSYFQTQKDAEYALKIGGVKPPALVQLRAEEKRLLNESKMPIAKAMEAVAKGGSSMAMAGMGKEPSADMQPMTGWLQRPRPQPEPPMVVMPTAIPDADAGTAALATDGGATTLATDAGMTGDAATKSAKDAKDAGGHEKHP